MTAPSSTVILRLLMFVGTAVMVGIVAVHFGLLNRAAWGGDEFATIGRYRIEGPGYLWFRLWSWSPRPVSEVLLALYAAAVLLSRQSLIVPLFALGWVVYLASATPMMRDGKASHLLGTAAILAFILLGPHVNAVFYWPIGIVAYMPVIAAALFLLFSLENEYSKRATSLVLVAAAWSSEWGALLVLIYSCTAMLHDLILRRTEVPPTRIVRQWSLPIVAAALVVLAAMVNSRTGDHMFATGDATLYHHLFTSLFASASRLPLEFLSIDGETFDARHFVLGAMVKILFFAGVHCCWVTRVPRSLHLLPVLALSIALTMFLTLAASYRQFGEVCCGQEAQMRFAMSFIALAALAIWLPPMLPVSERWSRGLAPVLLVAATIPLLSPRYKDLALDYIFYFEPGRAREMTWDSGFSPGPTMTLYQPVSDHVFPAQIPPGYQVAEDNWWTRGILDFFDKQSVTVLIAGRHEAAHR